VFTNRIPTQGLEFGEIIVADDNTDAIIRVNPLTGEQTLISQGGFFRDPENVVIDSDGNILVADGRAAGGNGAIIKVDPVTGFQTILSSNAISTLNLFDRGPEDLVLDANGDIIVLDDGDGSIIRVNPLNGEQTLISDNDQFSGRPEGIALEADGMIIVADGNGQKIIRVHPVTGAQTVISSGGELVRPEGVAVAADGSIFVADGGPEDSNSGMGKIIKVDPLGDQGNPGSAQEVIIDGAPFVDPSDVEILPNGDLIVSDDAGSADNMGAIYQVDPDTKMVTLISSNPISTLDFFDSPEGLAVVTLLPPEFVCEKLPPPPPEECPECEKPDIFTVLYNGPDGVEVIISKEGKDPVPFGTFNDGNLIVVDSNIDLGKSTVNPETTYTFSIGGEISIHTSCSKFPPTPHIGQEFFANKGTANEIKLTVFSGTLNGVPSIPDAICFPPPEECPECKRPQFLTVRYDNEAHPNEVVRVEVYKNADEFGDASKLLAEFDGIMNGDDITIDGSTFGSKNTVESNTAYCILFDSNLSTGLKSSTCVEFHTSCSQPLFVGDVHPGDFGVVITVVSGTDASGNPTIPDASCKPQ